MLEVNNFNAVRITLASPEQIRSWSRGEVTKPETINYRTLKPERDGLFCERIFGPTKDWECSCGKYKRVRYKGIICDKCGVEVTRAKVRRERMGHIELASPVSHIWFVKGTPSRIGLLLDITPRVLEQVLYFAKYIITEVHETGRTRLIQQIQHETEAKISREEREVDDQIEELTRELSDQIADLEARKSAALESIEAQRQALVNDVPSAAKQLDERMASLLKHKTDEDLVFTPSGKTIVETGSVVAAHHRKELTEEARDYFGRREQELNEEAENVSAPFDADIDRLKAEVLAKATEIKQAADMNPDAVREAAAERIKKIEWIKPRQTLNEAEYRELIEQCGRIFKAGMGAEAVRELLRTINLDDLAGELRGETRSSSGQRRKKATKRLRVVEAFRKSGNRPEWMVMTMLPVLPPDLRPMVQLDGGRFATSDLNDLYRRVINRNNRLKRLLELGAPEIIIRNEKRMLQEAVDSLVDNGRRGRAVSGSSNHKLKSLSDMLKGKQGRFRQNLLGKRVDYSGRSVIVVGPELKLHQCGLPKRMALELFKPFVMHGLVARGLAHNIKSAKRIVERARPEVWDILDDIIRQRPVLLNRAPTLHRLGIQAFEPVLIDGSAIQIHPLVCTAFNADFDGDQMAVHVPLSRAAVAEARQVMLSSQNLLYPSSGEPVVAPTLDIVLGCYYLTEEKPNSGRDSKPKNVTIFHSFDEAKMAYEMGHVDLRSLIEVRVDKESRERIKTTVGRIIFNEVLPEELGFRNHLMDKKAIKELVSECSHKLDNLRTAEMVDRMKNIGFEYATKSGISIAMNDLRVPEEKEQLLAEADARIAEIDEQYEMGLITDEERYEQAVDIWREKTDKVQEVIQKRLEEYGGVYIMAVSGAKGNISQISQMAGMRGLMSDPAGRIIELPIRSSFREGLSVLEYFISTHGARKGLADTALRTADSGYRTRRLIDVSQDVIIVEEDCGTTAGIWIDEGSEKGLFESLSERIVGRWTAADIANPKTGEIIAERGNEVTEEVAQRVIAAGIDKVYVRSALTCQTRRGICALCYGRDLSRGRFVADGEAVGIIAAQSIGEPGTQLTMRTFHTGGVAGLDITSGLPRVEELFEARVPKGAAQIAEIDGTVEISRDGDTRRAKITSAEIYRDEYPLEKGMKALVENGQEVVPGTVLAGPAKRARKVADGDQALAPTEIIARTSGQIAIEKGRIVILYEEREQRDYIIPAASRLRVQNGDYIHAGQPLTEGPLNPQDILRIQGPEAVQIYLVEEVQKVYRNQGVSINDKHIEVIVRQMLRRVRVDSPGDSNLLPGELVDRFRFESENARVLAEGGEPATAQPVLLGVTKASLNTESFLAAASFQETTRVLTEAAIQGQVDKLLGLKENVIIGKLIPARAQITVEQPARVTEMILPPGFRDEDGEFEPDFEELDFEDEDLEENGLDALAGEDEELAGNGALPEVDLLEESPPATAEEASELEASGNGAQPQPQATDEEPL